MTASAHNPRGSAPVGLVTELDAVGAGAVLYMRLWFDGPEAQAQVWRDFSAHLGPDPGRAALRSLERMCALCVEHGRRPLMRHHVECRCLGGDEACFAQFVGAASDGDHEDALMFAMTLIRADMAPCLVGLAEQFGLALKRMALATLTPPPEVPATRTLH